MQRHEFNLFPEMQKDEFQELKESISNGYDKIFPIIIYEEKILDGWNRYRACEESGIESFEKQFQGSREEALQFVLSSNRRRNLTASQRACLAVEYKPLFEKEAEKRLHLSKGRGVKGPELIPEVKESRDSAGSMLGVSGRYVSDAESIQRDSPEAFAEVKSGDKTITEAKKEIKKERVAAEVQKNEKLPEGKFRVIYADPPWLYATEQHSKTDQETTIGTKYPSMPTSDIAAMPIVDMCEDDAVLFIWTTSPKLFECKQVIDGWGFTYKASIIWDKIKHNVGHYVSVRHEFLLICTRGSCTPDVKKLEDSVVSIERGEHSAKPDYFREWIDRMYPHGKRVELFSRKKVKGWETFGNQI
jgi:N6-adenosine-specific RNA methylase IME4